MPEAAQRLSAYPHARLTADEALRATASELALLEHLGLPTAETDPSVDDPCLYWDLIWDCGLVMAVEFHQLSQELHLHLDRLDYDHALRHLGVEVTELVLLPNTDYARYRELAVYEPDLYWCICRNTPEGAQIAVASGLSERDATCRCSSSVEGDAATSDTLLVVHRDDVPEPCYDLPEAEAGSGARSDQGPGPEREPGPGPEPEAESEPE